MSKSRKIKRNPNPPTATAAPRRIPLIAVGVVVVALLATGAYRWSNRRHTEVQAEVNSSLASTSNIPAPAATPDAGLAKLKGSWLRPDGGYVLEIKSLQDSGTLDATYLNPRPIHVAKAEASRTNGEVKVFVELRDVNYPGSTYDLAYQPDKDQLTGIYYQAALQQKFEVAFLRIK